MNLKASTNDFLKQCKSFQFSKVTALGIAIIGVIGFIFVLVATLVGL